MRRKLLALALGLSLASAAITGCSPKKETEAETKAQTEAQQTEAKTEAKTEEKTEAPAVEAATEAAEAVTEAAAAEAVTEAGAAEAVTESAAAEAVTEAGAAEAVTEAAEVVTEAATEAAEEAATEAATEAAEEAATEAATEAAEEAATEAATEAAEVVTETATEAAEEVVTEAATEAAEEVVTEAATEAEEVVTEAATEAAEEVVTEAATEAAEVVTEAATEAEEVVTEAATEAAEVVTEAATEAEEVVTEAATEAAEVVTEAATEAEEVVTEAATEAAEVVTEAATEAAEEVVTEAATEAAEVVTEAATEAAAAAVPEAAGAKYVPGTYEAAAPGMDGDVTVSVTVDENSIVDVTCDVSGETPGLGAEVGGMMEDAFMEAQSADVDDIATVSTTTGALKSAMEKALALAAAGEGAVAAEEAVEAVTEGAEEAAEAVTEGADETVEAVTEAGALIEAPEEIEYTVTVSDAAPVGNIDAMGIEENDIVVLFNNDVHGGISNDAAFSGSSLSLGYAGMAAVKADVQSRTANVTTVDLGDAIQGSVSTSQTDGKAAMDLMDMVGYDIRVIGNHEFDYGMDAFLEYANQAGTFISCNFMDRTTNEAIFDGYKVISYDVDGTQFDIGYVGITTPEAIAKSTPTYFQDEEGNYIYGFDVDDNQNLYDNVQRNIDAAKADGADMIVAVGHMGDTGVEAAWSSRTVTAETTGINVFLDGHAHSVLPGEIIQDAEGNDVLLASTGTKLENIGVMTIKVNDGEVAAQTGLVNELTEEEIASDAYKTVDEAVQAIQDELAYLVVKVGSTPFDLTIYDPETGDRIIRKQETNMGDFLTDAYRIQMGADIAFMNGGSIRANLAEGDILFLDVNTVFPWNTPVSLIEVSGQVILDCLEMGAHLWPEECGGFIQPSGLSYAIDTTIPSSVEYNSDGEFVAVNGEYRVKNVMVGDEPLDLEKNYKLAINTYYSTEYGDGMTMFKGCKILVPAEGEEPIIDHDVIIDFLAACKDVVPEQYADPYGEGRITIIDEEMKAAMEAEEAVTEGADEAVTEDAENVTE